MSCALTSTHWLVHTLTYTQNNKFVLEYECLDPGFWPKVSVNPCSLHSLACSIRSVMQKYLEDRGEVTFEKIFSQKLGKCRHLSQPEVSPTGLQGQLPVILLVPCAPAPEVSHYLGSPSSKEW